MKLSIEKLFNSDACAVLKDPYLALGNAKAFEIIKAGNYKVLRMVDTGTVFNQNEASLIEALFANSSFINKDNKLVDVWEGVDWANMLRANIESCKNVHNVVPITVIYDSIEKEVTVESSVLTFDLKYTLAAFIDNYSTYKKLEKYIAQKYNLPKVKFEYTIGTDEMAKWLDGYVKVFNGLHTAIRKGTIITACNVVTGQLIPLDALSDTSITMSGIHVITPFNFTVTRRGYLKTRGCKYSLSINKTLDLNNLEL